MNESALNFGTVMPSIAHPMRRRDFLMEGSRAALGLCLLPLAGCATGRSKAMRSTEEGNRLFADLERLIPGLMAEARVPGASIAVVRGGKLFWHREFGVKDNSSKEAVDEKTVFEAASVSKTVFAYAALKLCEKGVIGLDEPLSRHASKPFLTGDPRVDLITPRQVLSHTSGFQDWRSSGEPLKIHFTPGGGFRYSGEGYHYLQSVITDLTGRVKREECAQYEAGYEVCATDIDEWMRRNLLAPFGMNSSGFVWNNTWEAARPHDADGKPLTKKKPNAIDASRYGSAGGLHTTALDYAKFLAEVLDPKPADGFRLSGPAWKEMLRPQVKLPENEKIDGASHWALGWAVQAREGGPVILHSGGQEGFRSLTLAFPERKSGFVMFTNGDSGGRILFHPDFMEAMTRLLA